MQCHLKGCGSRGERRATFGNRDQESSLGRGCAWISNFTRVSNDHPFIPCLIISRSILSLLQMSRWNWPFASNAWRPRHTNELTVQHHQHDHGLNRRRYFVKTLRSIIPNAMVDASFGIASATPTWLMDISNDERRPKTFSSLQHAYRAYPSLPT